MHVYTDTFSANAITILHDIACILSLACDALVHIHEPFLVHYYKFQPLTTLWKKFFENIVGKGENASNQHFLLFP